jgi:hypothetical protein
MAPAVHRLVRTMRFDKVIILIVLILVADGEILARPRSAIEKVARLLRADEKIKLNHTLGVIRKVPVSDGIVPRRVLFQ